MPHDATNPRRQLSRRKFLTLSASATLGTLGVMTALDGFQTLAITPTPSQTPTLLPPASKNMKGLFAILPPESTSIPPEVLNSPSITGVTLQIGWDQVQPSQTVVSWEPIEAALAQLAAVNKVLAIRVLAGTYSPRWIYEQGVKRYIFTPYSDLQHPIGFGDKVTVPFPWDSLLQKFWSQFVTIFAQRFDAEPNVVRVAVSGPMYQRAEMYLPRGGQIIADWVRQGYSLNRIQDTWQQTLDLYGKSFIQTPFTLDLNPMPDQADGTGYTVNALVPVAVAQYGLKRYPGRFFPATSDFADEYPYLPAPVPGPKAPPALYVPYERQLITIYDLLATTAKTSLIGLSVNNTSMSHKQNRIAAAIDRARALKSAYLEIPVEWVTAPENAEAIAGWRPYQAPPPTNTPAAKSAPTKKP
jgi:hypothetical protein